MATRKIRLTLSGTKIEDQGPIVDIDFNNENLDADVDVNAIYNETTIVKEYAVAVDVIAGTYNLDVTFKNDARSIDDDRNLYIEKIEFANDGINYEPLIISPANTNLVIWTNFYPMGWRTIENNDYNPDLPKVDGNRPILENSSFDINQPRSDDPDAGYVLGTGPGNNPKYQYEFVLNSVKYYQGGTGTFNITFS